MRPSLPISAIFLASATAQSPPGFNPITTQNLAAAYLNATIIPGVWISPDDVANQPAFYTANTSTVTSNTTYMILMLDHNIPDSDVTTADLYSTLVPGLAANTTTRLHWWGGNYTASPTGVFTNSSDALAEYTAPRPRDSTNHTYALYLFEQPEGYDAGEEALNGTYYSQTTSDRFNFTLEGIVEAVGGPVAATWFLSDAVA